MMKKIVAHYEQFSGEYLEDCWSETQNVSNAQDVFEFMRECHIRDARNRNDYPIVSHWDRWVDFYEQEYQVCNLGCEHLGKKVKIDPPAFYDEGYQMYKHWEARINRTLTHLRKADDLRKKELKERAELERLQQKYA